MKIIRKRNPFEDAMILALMAIVVTMMLILPLAAFFSLADCSNDIDTVQTEFISVCSNGITKETTTTTEETTTTTTTTTTTKKRTTTTTKKKTTTSKKTTTTTAAKQVDGMRYLGRYKITGYDACEACCSVNGVTASGVTAQVGRTVAMKGLPFGTRIYIKGLGYYVVEDRGVGSGKVDVFCNNHSECYAITGYYDVYIVEG